MAVASSEHRKEHPFKLRERQAADLAFAGTPRDTLGMHSGREATTAAQFEHDREYYPRYSIPTMTLSGSFGSLTQIRTTVSDCGTGVMSIESPSAELISSLRLGVLSFPSNVGGSPGLTSALAPSTNSVSPSTSDRHPTATQESVATMSCPRIPSGIFPPPESEIRTTEYGGATLFETAITDPLLATT